MDSQPRSKVAPDESNGLETIAAELFTDETTVKTQFTNRTRTASGEDVLRDYCTFLLVERPIPAN